MGELNSEKQCLVAKKKFPFKPPKIKNPYQLVSEHNQVLLAPLHCHEHCPESFSRLKVLADEVYHTDDGGKIL